ALAGCGKAKDDPPPDGMAKAELRKLAFGWLRADLTTRTKALESGDDAARAESRRRLGGWRHDSDLIGVRNPQALEKLPEAERDGCLVLWSELDAVLTRLAGGKP